MLFYEPENIYRLIVVIDYVTAKTLERVQVYRIMNSRPIWLNYPAEQALAKLPDRRIPCLEIKEFGISDKCRVASKHLLATLAALGSHGSPRVGYYLTMIFINVNAL